jgi:hypothetical protein
MKKTDESACISRDNTEGSHGMLRFDGWSKLGADGDRTELLNSVDGDANLNIYMLVK